MMNFLKVVMKAFIGMTIAFTVAGAANADLLVIVHPDNANKIDAKFVKSLYLGKVTRYKNGDPAEPLLLEEQNPLTNLFLKEVVKQKPVQFKRLWSKALFTGKGTPPQAFETEQEMIDFVMSNPSAIGFIDSQQYTNDVRAVLRLKTN